MAPTSRAVTIAAKLLGGKEVKRSADEMREGVRGVGSAVKESDDKARASGGGWEFFSRKTDEAGKTAHRTTGSLKGLIGGFAKWGVALGGGLLALSTVKSSIDSVGEKAEEVRRAQALGIGENSKQTLDILAAYKARDIGMSQLSMTMKMMAKDSFTAEQQEGKHSKAAARGAEQRARALDTYGRAVQKWEEHGRKGLAPMAPAAAKELPELGTKAKAFETLGINIQNFRKLNATKQLEEVGERLEKMPVGPERTRIATELMGRAATRILPLFEKGPMGHKALEKFASEAMPDLNKGPGGAENMMVAQTHLKIAMEGMKLALGQFLAPVMVKVVGLFTKLYIAISHGRGIWGTIEGAIRGVAGAFKGFVNWIKGSALATHILAGALILLGTAMAIEKVVKFVGMLRELWVVQKGMILAQTLWDIAMEDGVLVLGAMAAEVIIATAGLAALALGAYMLVTHWKQVKNFFVGIWNWMKSHWQLIGTIILGPMFFAVTEVIKHWSSVLHFFEGLGKGIVKIFEGIGSAIASAFKSAINFAIIEPIDWVFKMAHKAYASVDIPGLPSWGLPEPLIPKLAQGGTVRKGGWALIGERGPEVLRLPQGAEVDPQLSHSRRLPEPGQYPLPGGDLIVSVQIDRKEIGRAVVKELNALHARYA